jgi:hypothetical protein
MFASNLRLNSWITSLEVCKESLEGSLAHPREIFRPMIVHAAAGFVLIILQQIQCRRRRMLGSRNVWLKVREFFGSGSWITLLCAEQMGSSLGYFSFQEAQLL